MSLAVLQENPLDMERVVAKLSKVQRDLESVRRECHSSSTTKKQSNCNKILHARKKRDKLAQYRDEILEAIKQEIMEPEWIKNHDKLKTKTEYRRADQKIDIFFGLEEPLCEGHGHIAIYLVKCYAWSRPFIFPGVEQDNQELLYPQ